MHLLVLFIWGIGKPPETREGVLKGMIARADMTSNQHRLTKLGEVVLLSERVDYPLVRLRLFLPGLLCAAIAFGFTLGDHRPRLHVGTGTVLSKQVCMSLISFARQADAMGSVIVS